MTGAAGQEAPAQAGGPDRPERKALRIPATEGGVRAGLAEMRGFLAARGFDEDACGTVEIVLAEALNNIVEHAFADAGEGTIRITLTAGHRRLTVEIVDDGRPLPGLCPPAGQLPPLDASTGSLPEGGFGWYLIRTLTECLSYARHAGENHLCLRMTFPRLGD